MGFAASTCCATVGASSIEQVRASLRLGVDPTGTVLESLAALAAVGMEL
jgi:hypothetical protein